MGSGVRAVRRMVTPATVCLTAIVFLATASVATAASIIPVKTSRLNEYLPSSNAGYLMWSENSTAHPNQYNEFIQQGSGPVRNVNPSGSQGVWGAVSSDGTTAAFQEIINGKSNIELYNTGSHTVSNPPAGVNTKEWEWSPSIDGNYLLFARNDITATFPPDDVVLFKLSTDTQLVLGTSGLRKGYMQAGQVSGDYATYQKCSASVCNVYRYQISTATTTMVPNPRSKVNYASSVDTSGTVYFGRSGWNCGSNARLEKWTPGGSPPSTLYTPAVGVDFGGSFTETTGGGDVLFFDRVKCASNSWDIFKMNQP